MSQEMAMDRERAIATLKVLANKLVELSRARSKDEAWKRTWEETVNKFKEIAEDLAKPGSKGEDLIIIEDYAHRTLVFNSHSFALRMDDGSWLFVNPLLSGHQWLYRELYDMLSMIYVYSSVYVFRDFILVLSGGKAKFLKPMVDEPTILKPIEAPPNASENDKKVIDLVNRIVELNNRFGCIHPFLYITGCYELADELAETVRDVGNASAISSSLIYVVRPPLYGTPIEVRSNEVITGIVWESLRKVMRYDPCGDANCRYIFIVNDLDVYLIIPWTYLDTHSGSNIGVMVLTFKIDVDALAKQLRGNA